MREFFGNYQSHIIYAAIVVAVVIILHVITNIINNWLLKKEHQSYPGALIKDVEPVRILKRTLNTLWLILGIIALSFVFVDRGKDDTLIGYFKLSGYLGIVTVLTIISATLTNLWFKRQIKEKTLLMYDTTSYKFLRYVAVFMICFIGTLFGIMAFPSLRGVAQTALGGAGLLALIAGLASQEALSNLVGGLFIISFKPFRIGDVVKVSDGMVGTVTDITLRHTVIRNFENKMIVIPNAVINKEKLVNYNLGELKCCEYIEMNISYDSDIDLAKEILREECEEHPLTLDDRSALDKKNGKPMIRTALTKINDSSLTIRAWTWARSSGDAFSIKCDVLESTKKRYDKEGVDLPFPARTITFKNDKMSFDDGVKIN